MINIIHLIKIKLFKQMDQVYTNQNNKNSSFNSNISNKYLFVGRLIADKGINELVVAFKNLISL